MIHEFTRTHTKNSEERASWERISWGHLHEIAVFSLGDLSMRTKDWIIVSAVTLLLGSSTATPGQYALPPNSTSVVSTKVLRNADVLLMVRQGVRTDVIRQKILTSTCNFDVFPPVLADLKRRGVPEAVLQLMIDVPNGPPSSYVPVEEKPTTATVKVPTGLAIKVETLYPISSAKFKAGNSVALAVIEPVYVDGVLVIARNTIAWAKILKLRKAGNLGRGGSLTWRMDEIRAVDGSKIPVQLGGAASGTNNGPQMAAGVAATAAVIFPYTAPAAAVWAFKKGDEAVVRGSKRFAAVSIREMEVIGIVPNNERVFYHNSIKAAAGSAAPSTEPASFPRLPVRN